MLKKLLTFGAFALLVNAQVDFIYLPSTACDWCRAVTPIIEERIASHRLGGSHREYEEMPRETEEETDSEFRAPLKRHGQHHGQHGERIRQQICENFRQVRECHDFLSNYGKVIAKKVVNGEENICDSLIDITQNRNDAFMCSENEIPWTVDDDIVSEDNSFDIFFSLMKEMSRIIPVNTEVVQTTEIVQDQRGQIWQKTETFYSNSESGAWIDFVKIEQISGEDLPIIEGDRPMDLVDSDSPWSENHHKERCLFGRIKNAITRELKRHQAFYLSFFITFTAVYCLFSCFKTKCPKQQQQQQNEKCMDASSCKEKSLDSFSSYNYQYPGNVVVQIGLVSPTKEKVIQRPI